MLVIKCPFCDNNIRITTVKFPIENDSGGMILKCEKCEKNSYYETINPFETRVLKGGQKIDFWDDYVTTNEKFISKFDNIKELKDGILIIGEIEKREYEFIFKSPHIYHCSNCQNEVESISKIALINESQLIAKQYDLLMNFILANHRHESDNLLVEIESKCSCNKLFTSYWHRKFISDGKKISPEKDLFLIGTDMPVHIDSIDGIMSKNDCKRILEKFIIRWNAIYPRLLLVTPFVGHQWMSQEEVIELWEWIKNFLDPSKSSLVTRTATYNKYKKACEEKGISLEILDKYGLNNSIIQDFTKKQDFHSKIYVGYSSENAEMLVGSFNLMDGPSVENISFKSADYNTFINKFINPMNIPIVNTDSIETSWLRIFKKENAWSSNTIKSSDVLDNIMNYQ